MLKLMRLEMKKLKLRGFALGAFFTTVGMLGFLILLIFTSSSDGDPILGAPREAVDLIITLVNDAFLIFSAVMLSKFVIGEYSTGTINILFTYPIDRRKLIGAKLLTVGSFMVSAMVIANLFILAVIYVIDKQADIVGFTYDPVFLVFVITKVVIYAFAFTGISTLCLYFGMIKKSQAATIVSSVIIVSVVGSSSNGYSLSSYVIIPVIIASVGILMSYLTFRKIERVDV